MNRNCAYRLTHTALGAGGIVAVLFLAACTSGTTTTNGAQTPTSRASAPQARVAQITPAEGDSTIEIGVGEEQVTDQLMKYLPTSMAATCTPGANGGPYTVTIDSPNGWHIVLTHGSQQFTAENSQLGFRPAATFVTDQQEIDISNGAYASSTPTTVPGPPPLGAEADDPERAPKPSEPKSQFNQTGLTWDKPTANEVEAQISGRKLPEYWPFRDNQGPPEFVLRAHVKC